MSYCNSVASSRYTTSTNDYQVLITKKQKKTQHTSHLLRAHYYY